MFGTYRDVPAGPTAGTTNAVRSLGMEFFNDIRTCCAEAVVKWVPHFAGQRMTCTACGNSARVVESSEEIFETTKGFMNVPQRRLIKGLAFHSLVYSRNMWDFGRIEHDLADRGVVAELIENPAIVTARVRPVGWFDAADFRVVVVDRGVRALLGKLLPQYKDRVPTPAELSDYADEVRGVETA